MHKPLSFLFAMMLVASAPLHAVGTDPAKALYDKVRADLEAAKEKPVSNRFVYYTVPAISNIKRTAYTYPVDGKLGGPLRIVAAKGEFESASFLFYPFADASKVDLKLGDLVGANGKIPASAIDMRVVKIWYQAGTAWYSYFADSTGRELVPELLLKDENLVKVDHKTKDNYLRVEYPAPRGVEYVWISNPLRIDYGFDVGSGRVADAETLQPFSLRKGELKQIWLTLEAPRDAEGRYTGTISVTVDGKPAGTIPLEVVVLPFELPDPKTNYDLSRNFYTILYNGSSLRKYALDKGGDYEAGKKRLLAEFTSMRKHNVLYPILGAYDMGDEELLTQHMEVYKKAGLGTDALFGFIPASPTYEWMISPQVKNSPLDKQPIPEPLFRRIDRAVELVKQLVGHTNVYAFGWDEPAMYLLVAERLPWKYVHEKGAKIFTTGHDGHLSYGGYNEDFINYGGAIEKTTAAKWHAVGARIVNYAYPHTGPENPDFVRRTHGMDVYLSDSDGIGNYIINGFPWNDFLGGQSNFRSFNMIYPGTEGPIETIQWEGLREAVDDVRYATLLRQLATKAIATGKVDNIYQGRLALLWLETLDAKTADLNAVRMEMISYILKLKSLL